MRVGVEYAALTDHDTTQGLAAFEEELAGPGVGFLTGVEITVGDPADAVHILAYGIDPENAALQRLLATHRQYRRVQQASIRADLARLGQWFRRRFSRKPALQLELLVPDLTEIIRIVHRAGGTAFLAHPLTLTRDPGRLDRWLGEMKTAGLDGIEAVYAGYNRAERELLLKLAGKHGLMASAGTDYHGRDQPGLNRLAIDMPLPFWNAFSRAHGLGREATGSRAGARGPGLPVRRRQPMKPRKQTGRKRRFALRIVLPTLLATALFISTIYALILPALSDALMQRKRETIRELTYSAWSVLASYEADARAGLISDAEARARAAAKLEEMRYGNEQKDYFWITNLEPEMIMHPYRTDLNGTDVSDFRDPQGTAMFVEFAAIARQQGEGYVDYYWQWKDDPERVVPKESFVKLFKPWNWVIGTGLYLDDVHAEISELTGKLNRLSLGITAVIVLLLAFITWESLKLEEQRSRAEYDLRESHEKYAALVAATTEGTLMVLDGHCAYANRTMADILGYSDEELAELELAELFAVDDAQAARTQANIEAAAEGKPAPARFEGSLRNKDGRPVNLLLAVTRIAVAGKSGVIIVARDLSGRRMLEAELDMSRTQLRELTEKLDIGVFRASGGTEPRITEISPAARRIFGFAKGADPTGSPLLEVIADEKERQHIRRRLESGRGLTNHIIQHETPEGRQAVLSLTLTPGGGNGDSAYNGTVEDITARQRSDEERDTLLQEYQSALLFLNEPLSNVTGTLAHCEMNTPVDRAAQLMSRQQASSLAVVASSEGAVVGIVTDYDFRERVVAAGLPADTPVHAVMTAPVVSLPANAPVYEAILTMQQQQVDHIGIRDTDGRIVSIVQSADLMQFHQYSSAVITGEIRRARTVDEIREARSRLPRLVSTLLASGARPRNINRTMTRMSDTIVERLLELALGEIGPPPCRFCYLALGSEGRGEQTLVTDQDSALIIEDLPEEEAAAAEEYFLRLSELITSWLDRVGYAYCPGGVMCSNRKWRRPLAAWKRYFQEWITGSSPEDLLQFNIFFDFRPVAGDSRLLAELRRTIHQLSTEHPPFLLHFAQNALLYKPPLGLLGNIKVESGGDKANTINIKDAMLSVVNFARLYSLKHQLSETNTLDRLRRLYELQVLRKSFYEEAQHAYSYMMELRLNHQAEALIAGREPDNALDPRGLNQMQETMLRQAFSLLSLVRKKISHDFLGMA